MKTYEIAVDVESYSTTIQANSEEEAKQLAIEKFMDYKAKFDLDFWVCDCYEVE